MVAWAILRGPYVACDDDGNEAHVGLAVRIEPQENSWIRKCPSLLEGAIGIRPMELRWSKYTECWPPLPLHMSCRSMTKTV
eukprot:7465527-Pyramimonas_sp.AAC.1